MASLRQRPFVRRVFDFHCPAKRHVLRILTRTVQKPPCKTRQYRRNAYDISMYVGDNEVSYAEDDSVSCKRPLNETVSWFHVRAGDKVTDKVRRRLSKPLSAS
jgi:hypothetical protein